MIEIHFLSKTFVLTSDKLTKDNAEKCEIVVIKTQNEVQQAISNFVNNKNTKLTLLYSNLETLFTYFSECFKSITAAGGVVSNNKGEVLFIFRNGKWDLPKGKVEKGEKVDEAAIREVEEECGVSNVEILNTLPSTYHIYPYKGKNVLKRTYWYSMTCNDSSKLIPQVEEGITEVKWISISALEPVKNNTFPSILYLLNHIGV